LRGLKPGIIMNKEIERKFLIETLPDDLDTYPCFEIQQGYILYSIKDAAEFRLRAKNDMYFQTIKYGKGLERTEIEIELNRHQFETLWPLTKGKRLQKKRYEMTWNTYKIEIDVYTGALSHLRVAEIEFVDIEASRSFNPPEWFGREITTDERFKNRSLALAGIPDDFTY